MKILYFKKLLLQHLLTIAFLCNGAFVCGQMQHKSLSSLQQTFNSSGSFIENIGQYGKLLKGYENMDTIIYGYEGLGMPVLFTKKGLIHLQRKVDNKVLEEAQTTEKENVTDRVITMEWVGANSNVAIIKEEKTFDYHTYGLLEQKAYGYKKIIYKNLYNGIDLVYHFTNTTKPGFEYYLQVRPGAAIKAVKMKYGADVKTITKNPNGSLVITSDIGGVEETIPVSYYKTNGASAKNAAIKTEYKIDQKEVSFSFLQGYNKNREIIIDPFVSSTGNLDGTNAGKAKDIDFDYDGNVYVTGGGDVTTNHRLAKYDANGVLLWTFNGVLTTPVWEFGYYNGGWVVEKGNGKIYLGQGTNTGIRKFIRLNTNGLYDNYIIGGTDFFNMWKMIWSCNNGTPQILVGGGGTITNFCLMQFTPSVLVFQFSAITGSLLLNQNFADFLVDPVNNDMYSIFACINGAPVNNGIYKNAQPYNPGTISWSAPSGYTTLAQVKNRPYLVANPNDNNDNSANVLAINSTYLFYWDGKNLKAFNKTTGAVAGTPLSTSNTALMQGGIFADACNNVFVGDANGTIKVYNFNGTSFNDAPADITIPGYTTNAVYDLIYDESRQLLHACGDGFVASFDIASYCSTNNSFFSLNVVPNCNTASVTASLTPAPPAGTVVTYSLYTTGNTPIASNTTGIFTGLQLLTSYKIIATLNAVCSGIQVSGIFTLPTPAIATTITNTSCGNNNGQIVALGSGATAPYNYSIDGVNFFTNGTFTGLAANTYTVIVKDATGCSNTSVPLIIANSTGVNVTAALTSNTTCGFANGAITATGIGGVAPLAYSIDGGVTYQLSNSFTGLAANTYIITVKDAIGCTKSSAPVIIGASSSVSVMATSGNAICGFINGSITATGIGGVAPLVYSIDGGVTYQASPNFNGLPAATYTVTVKDAGNCTSVTAPIIISSTTSLTVSALSTNAVCGFANGSISATVNGGTAPYQYSIDGGVTYQASNVFNALAAAAYSIIVKDVNNCNNTATVVVANAPIPVLNVFAGNDTIIGINEPLQLNALDLNNAGFVKYEWSPSFGLNNNQLKTPVAILDKDFTYTLLATTSGGCKAEDKINIKVALSSQIYVPNAFTPNGDGNNDIIKPGFIGIRELKYFAIYNRYGQLIYKTGVKNEGWNGLINGTAQNTGTYVWMAEGIDYTGKIISAKGTTILIK